MKNTLKLLPLTVTLLICISTAAARLLCFSCSGSSCDRVPNPITQCAKGEIECMTRTVTDVNPQTNTLVTKIEKGCADYISCHKYDNYVDTDCHTPRTSISCCSGDFCNGDRSSVKLVSCKVCADQEKTCAKVSTMSVIQPTMCVIVNVKESPEGSIIKVVKGLAGPPLCTKPGDFTYIYGPHTIEVKCCNDDDSCNSGFKMDVEVLSCEVPNYCPPELHRQLQGLSWGHTVLD